MHLISHITLTDAQQIKLGQIYIGLNEKQLDWVVVIFHPLDAICRLSVKEGHPRCCCISHDQDIEASKEKTPCNNLPETLLTYNGQHTDFPVWVTNNYQWKQMRTARRHGFLIKITVCASVRQSMSSYPSHVRWIRVLTERGNRLAWTWPIYN